MTAQRISRPARPTDFDLLQRVATGDLGALGDIYDVHAAEVAAFARLRVPPAEIDDVVQDTFLRVLRVAGTFDGRKPDARSWIFGVVVAIVRERRRAYSRLVRTLSQLAAASRVSAPTTRTEALDVDQALELLSEPKREVLLLSEIHGFSGDEVAEMLGVPVGTVWTRLHHARRELRAILGEGT